MRLLRISIQRGISQRSIELCQFSRQLFDALFRVLHRLLQWSQLLPLLRRCAALRTAIAAPIARITALRSPSRARAAFRQELGAIALHVAVINRHGATLHDPQPVRGCLHEMPVMTDQDDRALILRQCMDQRLAAVDIEMVRRLIENEEMRCMECSQRQQQSRLFTA